MKMNPQIYNLVRHLNHLDLGDNQFKYLERDEYYDLRNLTKLQLDGNQLSVIVDNLFEQQKNLKFLGNFIRKSFKTFTLTCST